MSQIELNAVALGRGRLNCRGGWATQTRFGLLGREGVAGVLLHVHNRDHRQFQSLLCPLGFAVVEPVQAVGVTTTFLQKGAIDHHNLSLLRLSDWLNQGLIEHLGTKALLKMPTVGAFR
jgi:hypothetical protein